MKNLIFWLTLFALIAPSDQVQASSKTWVSHDYFIILDSIQIIDVNDRYVTLVVVSDKIVATNQFTNVNQVNSYFKSIVGVESCSYSWNNGIYKLTLQKSFAKSILLQHFNFSTTYLNTLF